MSSFPVEQPKNMEKKKKTVQKTVYLAQCLQHSKTFAASKLPAKNFSTVAAFTYMKRKTKNTNNKVAAGWGCYH